MDDKTSMQNTIEAGVTALTLKIDSLTMLALTGTEEDETPDKFSDRGKLVFLSIMSHSISHTLGKQNGFKEAAGIWQELSMALSDVADGKSAELFRPLKEWEAQPRRISVHHEMYFSIAAAVCDRAEKGQKKKIREQIARRLKVKPSALESFGKNLVRSDPNIKSAQAHDYYNGVFFGQIIVDENELSFFGTGNPSPVDDWLKWFDNLRLLNEV